MKNPYDTAKIVKMKKYPRHGDTIYAELHTVDGELLICATLEYIVQSLNQRMTKIGEPE